MKTITLYVDHITGAYIYDAARIVVQCTVTSYAGLATVQRDFLVHVEANSAAVIETCNDAAFRSPSDVLVSVALVDATRRLYNLGGAK